MSVAGMRAELAEVERLDREIVAVVDQLDDEDMLGLECAGTVRLETMQAERDGRLARIGRDVRPILDRLSGLEELLRELDAYAGATELLPPERLEVYERHCGDPSCRCESMIARPDEDGDYVRAEDAEALYLAAVGFRNRALGLRRALEEITEDGR